MPFFRKKPVVIEAVQWTGDEEAINKFMGKSQAMLATKPAFQRGKLLIQTLEGEMTATKSDWIIKGVNGEFYPCKADIFKKTYEPA